MAAVTCLPSEIVVVCPQCQAHVMVRIRWEISVEPRFATTSLGQQPRYSETLIEVSARTFASDSHNCEAGQ